MKNILKFMLFTLILTVLVACGQTETDKSVASEDKQQSGQVTEQQFPIKVTDALGREMTIEEKPKRIVSLIPSNTEILFELGVGEKVVGVNDYDNYPPEVEKIEKVGSMEYNLEVILSLQPDLVVAHEAGMYGLGDGLEQLEAAGVQVFVVKNAINFEETYETILEIGQITGTAEKANEIKQSIQNKLKDIEAKVANAEQRSAFVVVGVQPEIYAVGQKTYLDEMLKVANIKNAVAEEGWPVYSAEQFVASDADFVIATYASDLELIQANSQFKKMAAIQANNLAAVDGDITSRQGPRLAEGVELLAKAVYPELFNE